MSKELFLKNKALANKWREMATSDDFAAVLIFARSEIVSHAPDQAELRGVERLAHTLRTLADAEDAPFEWPTSGINHHPEAPPERPEQAPAPATSQPQSKPRKKR